MRFIAHRGNIFGPNPLYENSPEYILNAIHQGYDCEIDIWVFSEHNIFLGHDYPQYKISVDFILNYIDSLWIHCKNETALYYCNILSRIYNIHYFYHDKDHYTITSKNIIWGNIGRIVLPGSICVMPEYSNYGFDLCICGGICSDFIYYYKYKCYIT